MNPFSRQPERVSGMRKHQLCWQLSTQFQIQVLIDFPSEYDEYIL